eukprot:TRINITY_DN32632_c0_g1_i1.p1 TRINITY_DN32632_c0_g1~~TRINITY_DN32632_c0_g1_i1.p1  ORF type:complete len:435 (-),score=25.74 TRINITY_DN32632_c0_g1_i1:238-1542(-)
MNTFVYLTNAWFVFCCGTLRGCSQCCLRQVERSQDHMAATSRTRPRSSLRIACYNPFTLKHERLQEIVTELRSCDVLLLSGTKVQQRDGAPFHVGALDTHRCIHFGYGRGKGTNHSAGICICWKKTLCQTNRITQIFHPPKLLQGRGGAIRVKQHNRDMLFICAYPPPITDRSSREVSQKVYGWIDQLLKDCPRRCTPVVGLDANGRVGLESLPGNKSDVVYTNSQTIGTTDAEVENFNGQLLKQTMTRHFMSVANTFHAAGPTYHGIASSSRIDYVCIPTGLRVHIQRCEVWNRSGDRLQYFQKNARRDHRPVVLDFQYTQNFVEPVQTAKLDMVKLYRALQDGRGRNEFVREINEWAGQAGVLRMCEEHTVDMAWHQLTTGIKSRLHKHFGLSQPQPPASVADARAERRELLANRAALRVDFLAEQFLSGRS